MSRKRPWYLTGGYKHFDVQVGEEFALKTESPDFVVRHSWLPFIKYMKSVKRYRREDGKTYYKKRPIMYASHRDACILKRYARILTRLLDEHYALAGLNGSVIAYRKLGKANYHFAADALHFAETAAPCMVLCFDITGFFDHLDHQILKSRLKRILDVNELPSDWHRVFRAVSRYFAIEREHLQDHPVFGLRLSDKAKKPIASISDIKAASIKITKNPNGFGIPQGRPISSVFSNLYLLDFDRAVYDACHTHGALYQRYSDDILIICPEKSEMELISVVERSLSDHKLMLANEVKKDFSAGS